MVIEAIIFSLVVGLIRGGKIRRFKTLNQRTVWILILGILAQYTLVFFNKIELVDKVGRIISHTREIMIISYILIFIGILTNIKFRSLWFTLLGFAMNFLVYSMNSWKIPILVEATSFLDSDKLGEIIETGHTYLYTPMTESIKYPILGNIIIFSKPYPIAKIISLGDLIIGFGIFALIQEIMLTDDSFMGGYTL